MNAGPRVTRVAIYTRQSVASDLEFGSIQAQREAVEAYVASQRGLGWAALPERYDDHGFSGGNVARPAFQRLLADIEAGHVDIVATYKTDRISRSLADFTGFMTMLECRGIGFVSTTQNFDTRTSLGRLTLNILASFSQFERELAGERIRDKLQATRRRGQITGGRPVLGYDIVNKQLVVNPTEAARVRETFDLYVRFGSLREVVAELRERGWHNKSFTNQSGEAVGGGAFTKATLHILLTNPLYRGLIRCHDGLVAGQHEAIVSEEQWTAVQERLQQNRNHGGAAVRNKTEALLRGLVICGRCGSGMVHSFSTKKVRRHRYYVCSRAHNEGTTACPGARVAAGKFETFVVDQLRVICRDPVLLAKTAASAARLASDRREQISDERRRIEQRLKRLRANDGDERQRLEHRLHELAHDAELLGDGTVDGDKLRAALAAFNPVWDELWPRERERIVRLLVERVTYNPDDRGVEIDLRACGIEALAEEATT